MIASKRLNKICDCVEYAECIADIGTDHAYLPIILIENKKASRVIAMDVREKPLKRAEENISAEGLKDKIDLRLSDGAEKLQKGEADVITISGMGGELMSRIIMAKPEVFKAVREMYLSPQSEVYDFRKMLIEAGYRIADEWMICEDNKYYFIIKAAAGLENEAYTECELLYGRRLIEKKDTTLKDFLLREKAIKYRVIQALEKTDSSNAVGRLKTLREELGRIDKVIGQITG